MTSPIQLAFALTILLFAVNVSAQNPELASLRQQVEDTERAFAQTMVDRDHEAFVSFLSEETIFFAGMQPLRGKQAVADAWAPYYEGPEASFSWEPEVVVVQDSGSLALSSGPVHDSGGNRVATFTSIWRFDADGVWRIIFDKGCRVCAETPPTTEDE